MSRWEIACAAIGLVTDSRRLRVLRGQELLGDMPVEGLVDECPLYELSPRRPHQGVYPPPLRTLPDDVGPRETLLALLGSPNLASRRPLFEQYDSIVQSRTVRRPAEADAAVLALPDGSALAVSIDCNGRRVAADPYRGTVEAVLECSANLACTGAEPLGTTNNLNFGNPEKEHIAWQLTEAVRGLGDACRELKAPIVGGNVSLYNEGPSGPIYPTPVVGMVGALPDAARAGRLGFRREGDVIAVVGPFAPSPVASELEKLHGRPLPEQLPAFDLQAVHAAHRAIRDAVREGVVVSAHDIAEGGLAVALAECCLAGGLGATVTVTAGEEPSTELFGEGPGGFLVERSVRADRGSGRNRRWAGDRNGRRCGPTDRASGLGGRRDQGAAPRRPPGVGGGQRTSRGAVSLMLALGHMREGPRDECGVFGLYAPGHEVSRLSYFALYALQHRGQESAGIAAADRGGNIVTRRELGLVSQVFSENDLRTLAGDLAIGHVRYSTTGSNAWENSQPVQRSEGTNGSRRELALAHNGNLINALELHDELLEKGVSFSSSSDSEIIAAMIATHPAERVEDAIAEVLPQLQGAFSIVVMTKDRVVAFRDPVGLRPLALGTLPSGEGPQRYCVASESCAFDIIGANYVRELEPGEIVTLSEEGLQSRSTPVGERPAFCVFEYIYFARPDSRMNGQVLQVARGRMGEILWQEAPVEADVVIAVPDSGNPAARGLARAAGLPQDDGFVKNRYVARTFIQPGQELRKHGLRLKFNPLPEVISGKRLVVVDDSIVRGNTTRQIVQMLRDAGAAEIHMRISAPPIKNPCHYGIDMSSREEMIAHERTTEQIAEELGVRHAPLPLPRGRLPGGRGHPLKSLRRLLHRRLPARGQRLGVRQVLPRAGRGGPHGQRRRGPGAGRPQRHGGVGAATGSPGRTTPGEEATRGAERLGPRPQRGRSSSRAAVASL